MFPLWPCSFTAASDAKEKYSTFDAGVQHQSPFVSPQDCRSTGSPVDRTGGPSRPQSSICHPGCCRSDSQAFLLAFYGADDPDQVTIKGQLPRQEPFV